MSRDLVERPRFVTKWNKVCGRILKKLLPRLERDKQGVEKFKALEHDYELQVQSDVCLFVTTVGHFH